MAEPDDSRASRYCGCMEDIKVRVGLIRRMVGGYSPLGNENLDGEIVCLQLRKILEQIAFGSLLAHRETYDAAHKDLERIWRAKTLLDRLAVIHPEFYPQPVEETDDRPMGVRNFAYVKDGFLTKDDFVFLYDTASAGIHVWNPYKRTDHVIDFERSISEWVQRIQKLLGTHVIRFPGKGDVWLIQMANLQDGKVHASIAAGM